MKKNKEMISLNSISVEFNNEMGINERFEILDRTASQKIKGGDDCPTMSNCGVMEWDGCPYMDGLGGCTSFVLCLTMGWDSGICPSMT